MPSWAKGRMGAKRNNKRVKKVPKVKVAQPLVPSETSENDTNEAESAETDTSGSDSKTEDKNVFRMGVMVPSPKKRAVKRLKKTARRRIPAKKSKQETQKSHDKDQEETDDETEENGEPEEEGSLKTAPKGRAKFMAKKIKKSTRKKAASRASRAEKNDGYFEVEDILKVNTCYFIKWKNYPSSENEWVPKENITADALKHFHKTRKGKGKNGNVQEGEDNGDKAGSESPCSTSSNRVVSPKKKQAVMNMFRRT